MAKFKVGDRVSFGGKTGTVVALRTKGMVDVQVAGRIERRHVDRLARQNTMWEEKGLRSVVGRGFTMDKALIPYRERARTLGRAKGAVEKQLKQPMREAARQKFIKQANEAEDALRDLQAAAIKELGLKALDGSGLLLPEYRAQISDLYTTFVNAEMEVLAAKKNPEGDLYDPSKEQFRATVEGVYESLVRKELGLPYNAPFKTNGRLDARLSATKRRELLSRAYAIATRQGQKHGWLEEGTQMPTLRGSLASYARTRGGSNENRQDYEETLRLVRKGSKPRVVAEMRGSRIVSLSQPGGYRVRMNARTKGIEKVGEPTGLGRPLRRGEAKPELTGTKEEIAFAQQRLRARSGMRSALHGEQMETNFTPTMVLAVPPSEDADLLGYFIVTYDPRNKRVVNALAEVSGWRAMANVSAMAREKSLSIEAGRGETIKRVAPKLHTVIAFRSGAEAGRQAGKFGPGQYAVVGPLVKVTEKAPGAVFDSREAAEAHALVLDQRAATNIIPQTHRVVKLDMAFIVQGPSADVEHGGFDDETDAEEMARRLDRIEAMKGAVPIAAKRTKEGASAKKAVELLNDLLMVFDSREINVRKTPTRFQIDNVLRGPPAGTPDPRFVNLSLAEVKRELLRKKMSEDEVEAFIADEKLRRQKFMPTRLRLEAERARVPKPEGYRKPKREDFTSDDAKKMARLREERKEIEEALRKLRAGKK